MLYRELRIQYFAAKEEQRIAYQRMMKLKSTNEPAHKLERYAFLDSPAEHLLTGFSRQEIGR
jgi:hypothetical protein